MTLRIYMQNLSALRFVGLYFILSAVTAIIWPSLWYALSGIDNLRCDLALAVVGVMMLSLGVGAFLAISRAEIMLMLKLLIIANGGDAVVVSLYTLNNTLPVLNGLGFLGLDVICIIVLTHCYLKNSQIK